MNTKKYFLCFLFVCLFAKANLSFGQCTWSSFAFDSFEYSTTIPDMVPGMCYQSTPQTYTGCIRSGARGMYMNIVNGLSGVLYNRTYSGLCVGQNYRFSFSVRDAFTSVGNVTFNVYDSNNNLLQTLNVVTNSIWQDITMFSFAAPSTSVRFEIVTNLPGGPGNDIGFDDLRLSACNPTPFSTNLTQCYNPVQFNLYSLINTSGLSANGVWTGPTSLQNGALGTFDPITNVNGSYTYSISRGLNCPDSVATVAISIFETPTIDSIGPLVGCSSVILPPITGVNLSGQQKYYTQPNGNGQSFLPGSTINFSQTLYLYDGLIGCSDQKMVQVIVDTPVSAGFDNAASYCGPGQVIQLNSFISASATTGGTWTETTSPSSGALNPSTGNWNSAGVVPGNYTFTYTVPSNGACPSDIANFAIHLGSMPAVDLGNDTTLCAGQTLWLNAGTYQSYLWNNGSINPTKFVNSAGTYWVTVSEVGANQVVNGDFEMGNTGFTTSYLPGTGGAWGLLSNAGTVAVASSPSLVHSNFVNCQDATPNNGVNMLIVNGASTPNTAIWCQTIPVQPNTNYQFSTQAATAVTGSNVAQLQFSINSSVLGAVFSPPTVAGVWSQFNQSWNSGITTTAQICIVNQNINVGGNDFMLDEIAFRPICKKSDTITVSYAANPIIDLGPDQFLCASQMADLDAGNVGSNYNWNNGDSTQHVQTNVSGLYGVTVTTPFGCVGSDSVVLSFESQQYAGEDTLIRLCSTDDHVSLSGFLDQNSTAGGNWNSNDFYGNYSTTGEVSLNGTDGIYHFSYIVLGDYCPNDTSWLTMQIFEQPLANPPVSLHFCNELNSIQDFSVYTNQPNQTQGAYWQIDSSIANVFDTVTSILQTGALAHGHYLLNYILGAESPCVQDTFRIDLQITQVPEVNFLANVTSGCQPLIVSFEDMSTTLGNVEYQWDFGNGIQSTSQQGDNVAYLDAACYDVSLTVIADNLCSSTMSYLDMICSYPLPEANFSYGPQQVYSDGPTVEFNNMSTENTYNSWSFGDGGSSSVENPIWNFPLGEVGNYLVTLIVESDHGCLDTTSQLIVVKDQLLYYIPNTFTPDGNEYNNVFLPVLTAGFDLYNYELEIYNRWGQVVFVSHDYSVGWDGTIDGNKAQDGSYTWKLKVKLLENDEKMVLLGKVNLLR